MNKAKLGLGALTLSLAGLGLIRTHEGTVYTAYADPAWGWKVPTICSGHTKGVYRGMTATKAECQRFLQEDTKEATAAVLRLSEVPLSQGELDAYTSFVFNAGAGNFAKSTLLKRLNAGRRVDACNELLKWDYAAGKRLAGLTTRRKAERDVCLSTLA